MREEGKYKAMEQNKEKGEEGGIRGKEREENGTDKNSEREKQTQRRARPRERDRRAQGGIVRDQERQSQT